jgi:hypothetical protein
MWEMVTGQQPWGGKNAAFILQEVSKGRRPPLPGPVVPLPGHVSGQGLHLAGEDEHAPAIACDASSTALSALHASMPASSEAVPEFNAIIRACWHQRDLRRPTASEVHAMLLLLVARAQRTALPEGGFSPVYEELERARLARLGS